MLVAANAGMMQSVWRKGGETSIDHFTGGIYQLSITDIAAARRI
jgi:hypothetical protein